MGKQPKIIAALHRSPADGAAELRRSVQRIVIWSDTPVAGAQAAYPRREAKPYAVSSMRATGRSTSEDPEAGFA
jgi:hypothetical protein